MSGNGFPRPNALVCGAGFAVAAIWVIVEHASAALLPYDDAFITYRYVDNLIRGAGLTYNPPVHAWGFTSPLYVLWLAALHLLLPGIATAALAARGNAIFVIATGAATLLLVRRYSNSLGVATVAACTLMVHPSLLSISVGGMESFLFLALALFAMLAMSSDRPVITGVLIGLAFLTRPEGVVLLPAAALWYWRTRARLGALLLCAVVLPGIWLAFAAAYFHSVIPLSIIAKERPLYPLSSGYALRIISAYLGPSLFGPIVPATAWRNRAAALLILASTTACLSPGLRTRGAWMPGFVAIVLIALYDYGNPMFFEWYWPGVLGTVLLAIITGSAALPGRARWLGAIWLASVTLATYGDNAGGHSKSIRYLTQDGTRLRIVTYERIGKYLSALTGGHDSVAAAEVGALGYSYSGQIIDACGLVSTEAIPFLPVPADQRVGPAVGAIPIDLIQASSPDWVVTMPIFVQKSLMRSGWFADHYELVQTVPLPKICFDSRDVLLYKKRAQLNQKLDTRARDRTR